MMVRPQWEQVATRRLRSIAKERSRGAGAPLATSGEEVVQAAAARGSGFTGPERRILISTESLQRADNEPKLSAAAQTGRFDGRCLSGDFVARSVNVFAPVTEQSRAEPGRAPEEELSDGSHGDGYSRQGLPRRLAQRTERMIERTRAAHTQRTPPPPAAAAAGEADESWAGAGAGTPPPRPRRGLGGSVRRRPGGGRPAAACRWAGCRAL
jgi:hypothetical protein